LDSIIQKTLEAISDGDLRTIKRETSYNPSAWLAWRHGNKPRIIFSSKDIIQKGEPSIVFTPPTIKSDHPLVFQLSEDAIKQLLQDYHNRQNISENFITSNLWKLRSLCKEYRISLKDYLEAQMYVDFEIYLSSCILFLHSISKGVFLPKDKDEIITRLKEILEESDKIEDETLVSLRRSLPQKLTEHVEILPLLVKLYRGSVFLRESMIDIQELGRTSPSNKTQLFELLGNCNVDIPLGFHIETSEKTYRLKILLSNIRRLFLEVTNTKVDLDDVKVQVQNWQTIMNRYDSSLKDTLENARKDLEHVSYALRTAGEQGHLLFRLLSSDADKLVNNHPKEIDQTQLSHLVKKIQNIDRIDNNTEEPFVLKKIYTDAKHNPTIPYLKDVEKWISTLRKDVDGFPQVTIFHDDIKKFSERILTLFNILDG